MAPKAPTAMIQLAVVKASPIWSAWYTVQSIPNKADPSMTKNMYVKIQ
jgi:hypothetical protein